MINSIQITGFKCFEDIQIPLGGLTVLAGGNSLGKSSVIQSILISRMALMENHPSSIAQIPLNGEYLLNLGNSAEVLSRKAPSNSITFKMEASDKLSAIIQLEADISYPQVFLTLSKLDANEELNIARSNFHYLNAERLGPRPSYRIGAKERNVGWQGEFTISLLSSNEVETPDYNVPLSKAFPDSKNIKLRNQADLWMDYIIPGVDVNPQRIREINQAFVLYNDNAPHNVGFGISYVLPIIVSGLAARKGEMLIVENPEAHLHPCGQSRIGQFLARVACSGVQVIVETHSEHVVNGIRLASLKGDILHQEVVINFFSPPAPTESQPEVKHIFLNENADLDSWPQGFFDQQQQDIAEIFRIRKARRK